LTLLQGKIPLSLSRFMLKYFLGGENGDLFPKSDGEKRNRYNT
jgi:hypothetical protein